MAIGVIGNTMEFDSIILSSSLGSLTINKQIVIATRKGIPYPPSDIVGSIYKKYQNPTRLSTMRTMW